MLEGFSLGSYLLLLDYTGRLFRDGKVVISGELTGILERLGSSAESWRGRLEKLKSGRPLGRFFAARRERLRAVAAHLGVHHRANLGGCLARQARVGWRGPVTNRWVSSGGPGALLDRDVAQCRLDIPFGSCPAIIWGVRRPILMPRRSRASLGSPASSRERNACPVRLSCPSEGWDQCEAGAGGGAGG